MKKELLFIHCIFSFKSKIYLIFSIWPNQSLTSLQNIYKFTSYCLEEWFPTWGLSTLGVHGRLAEDT